MQFVDYEAYALLMKNVLILNCVILKFVCDKVTLLVTFHHALDSDRFFCIHCSHSSRNLWEI